MRARRGQCRREKLGVATWPPGGRPRGRSSLILAAPGLLGVLEQPGGALSIGLTAAAQHLRQLRQALLGGQRANGGESPPAAPDFLDAGVLIAEGAPLG